ncbi:MAG: carotenoid oxygenase family protein [Alphaproteobacteria bacterium]
MVDPVARALHATVIDEEHNEFPRVRESLVGLPHRYGYCASPRAEAEAGWPTLKHDLVGGTRQAFDHGPGRAAGEPVFIPREGGRAEDDGWIMTFVHDLGAGATDLVLLDAADFDRGYVARVRLPERVPFGFHGNWVADRELAGRE